MSRATDEWIGKTDDTAIPPRVRLRVFERHSGICHISGRRIRAGDAWDLDHIVPLINGGSHRESNLAPALAGPHREKTAQDVAQKAKNDRVRKKFLGIEGPKWKISSPGFPRRPPQRTATRALNRKSYSTGEST